MLGQSPCVKAEGTCFRYDIFKLILRVETELSAVRMMAVHGTICSSPFFSGRCRFWRCNERQPLWMTSSALTFEIIQKCNITKARRSILHLPHGPVQTPTFMPVGKDPGFIIIYYFLKWIRYSSFSQRSHK